MTSPDRTPDPAATPSRPDATGAPRSAGTARFACLPRPDEVGPDTPSHDGAEITGVAAAHVGYDLLLASALNRGGGQP